jgi:hypothetical protein
VTSKYCSLKRIFQGGIPPSDALYRLAKTEHMFYHTPGVAPSPPQRQPVVRRPNDSPPVIGLQYRCGSPPPFAPPTTVLAGQVSPGRLSVYHLPSHLRLRKAQVTVYHPHCLRRCDGSERGKRGQEETA